MSPPLPSAEEFAKHFYTPEQLALLSENSLRAIYETIRFRDAAVRRAALEEAAEMAEPDIGMAMDIRSLSAKEPA